MPWNSYSQSNNGAGDDLYTRGGYEKKKVRIVVIIVCVLVLTVVLASVLQSRQDEPTRSATAAARKVTPNAVVSNLKVDGGFAVSTVSSPTASGQGKSGNITVFKVNSDGSMTQIANGSSFSPLDLLGLGIPLSTQAKLTGQTASQVQQALANTCDYTGGNAPGYSGFNGLFNPGGWEIDPSTLDDLEQALSATISNKNNQLSGDQKIICVNAIRENSNFTVDTQTYISTFTLELQFITGNGAITTHTFTFSIGPNYYRSYTLDGQKI
jgi:hypothetical protein